MTDEHRNSEGGFEVIDRRKRASGETDSVPPEDEPGSDGPEREPFDGETEGETVPPEVLEVLLPSTVESVLAGAFGHLTRLAWESIGLVASARTGQVAADFPTARKAIDAAQSIASHMRSMVPEEVYRDMDSTLTDLKVNLVKQEHRKESAP